MCGSSQFQVIDGSLHWKDTCFFRFLNSLGNPVELSRPDRVCQTQQFFQYAIVSDSVIDPTHHPCLHSLPTIFFKAMQGVSAMVDAYLGEFPSPKEG